MDDLRAEYARVVDATKGAVKIQKAPISRTADLRKNRRMAFGIRNLPSLNNLKYVSLPGLSRSGT